MAHTYMRKIRNMDKNYWITVAEIQQTQNAIYGTAGLENTYKNYRNKYKPKRFMISRKPNHFRLIPFGYRSV